MVKHLDDLKFADVLILRSGEKFVVADGCMYGEKGSEYRDSDTLDCCYLNDLTYDDEDKDCREYDIVQVIREGKTVFKREAKKMTVAEICKELGYEVEIIKEENE